MQKARISPVISEDIELSGKYFPKGNLIFSKSSVAASLKFRLCLSGIRIVEQPGQSRQQMMHSHPASNIRNISGSAKRSPEQPLGCWN
jgi:hypothetical protein